LHTRRVTYRGYEREDGLWDIEGELTDTLAYALQTDTGKRAPGENVHNMSVRVTVDDDMKVLDIQAVMDSAPLPDCTTARPSLEKLIGCVLGPGWRKNIGAHMGGAKGCTHLRELLFGLGSAAYQTIFPRRRQQAGHGMSSPGSDAAVPRHVGQCIGWDVSGTAVLRHYPQVHRRMDTANADDPQRIPDQADDATSRTRDATE
jgi:hypothetical protein